MAAIFFLLYTDLKALFSQEPQRLFWKLDYKILTLFAFFAQSASLSPFPTLLYAKLGNFRRRKFGKPSKRHCGVLLSSFPPMMGVIHMDSFTLVDASCLNYSVYKNDQNMNALPTVFFNRNLLKRMNEPIRPIWKLTTVQLCATLSADCVLYFHRIHLFLADLP